MREEEFVQKLANLSPQQRALLEQRRRGVTGSRVDLKRPPPVPAGLPAPASFAQQQLWFLHQLDSSNKAYHIYDYWRLSGGLDVGMLKQALRSLVDRHESLRTSFTLAGSDLIQKIHGSDKIPIDCTDLTGADESESELARLVQREAGLTFDLSVGPLTRFHIVILSAGDHALLMTTHHTVYDEWSRKVFWREFSLAYATLLAGSRAHFEPLPIRYRDYAYWQRQNTGGLSPGLDYWEKHLQSLDVLHLPFDFPRPAAPSFAGALTKISLSRQLALRTKRIAKDMNTTVFMVTLTTFAIFLRSHTDQGRLVVGIPLANRSDPDTHNLVGLLLNSLPIVIDVATTATFRELLQQIKAEVLNAQKYEHVPFELLVEKLRPARNIGMNPMYQVMCVLNQPMAEMLKLPGVSARPVSVERLDAKFDLTLFVTDSDQGLSIELEYNSDLFRHENADALVQRLAVAFDRVVQAPDRPVSQLNIMTDQDKILLDQWNKGSGRSFENETPIHQRFEIMALRIPGATALEQSEKNWSYGEMDKMASALAAILVEMGVGRGVLVPIIAQRNHHTVVAILAVLKAGGAYVPLDPASSDLRLEYMLDQIRPTWPDSSEACLLSSDDWESPIKMEFNVLNLSDQEFGCREPHQRVLATPARVDPRDPAYVIYTSGSTGQAKGVMVSHANLAHSTNARLDYYPGKVKAFLLLSPFWFDSSVAGLFWTFCDGGRLVLPPSDMESRLDRLAQYVEMHAISHTLCLPAVYRYLLRFSAPGQLRSLECAIVAGEACDGSLPAQHRRSASHASLYNEYGPTEATVWSTVCEITDIRPGGNVPVGRPIANSGIFILSETGQPAPPGVTGEIYVSGPGVAEGYLNDDWLTRMRFVANPLVDGPLYRTGDLGRFGPDGSIQFLGRKDNQVKVRGHRVELEEVDNLLKAYPGVKDAVVILHAPQSPQSNESCEVAKHEGRVDTSHQTDAAVARDQGHGTLVAWVVPASKSVFRLEEIKRLARRSMPGYMTPSHFMTVDDLPRLANGKVDRSALVFDARVEPDLEHSEGGITDPTQMSLCAMWKTMLNLSAVGIDDDFFDLGGHSLMAAQLVTQIEQVLGRRLSIADVFEQPTIRGLSEKISSAENPTQWSSIVPINSGGSKLPFFCVFGNPRAMSSYMDAERPFYWLHHGRDGLLMPYDNIDRMAEDHLQQVLAIQENGPYLIGGFSIGGLVALEMARLLRQQGKPVALLVLFDPTSPAHDQSNWQSRIKATLKSDIRVRDKVVYVASRIAKLPLIIGKNFGRAARRLRRKALRSFYATTNKTVPDKLRASHRWQILMRASRQYHYRPYDGAVALFLPEGSRENTRRLEALQQVWVELAGNQLETYIIKGASKHVELMREPFVADLAECLNHALTRASPSQIT